MDFKLVSKNNIGLVTTLLIIVLLTQSRVFDFLINTYLGRTVLIFLILGISYCHKIFGVIAILFIIIIFNQSNFYFIEGMESGEKKDTVVEKKANVLEKKEDLSKDNTLSKDIINENVNEIKKEQPIKALEGFNMIEKEDMMLRGKQSNTIPVQNTRSQNEHIEPSDKSVFSGAYTSV